MTVEWIHPGLVLIVGAWLLPFLKGTLKKAAMVLLPAIALGLCIRSSEGTHGVVQFLGQQLVFREQAKRFGQVRVLPMRSTSCRRHAHTRAFVS